MPPWMGKLSKGLFDLAKLEPALSRHPSGRISNHARVFAPVISNRISGTTFNTLKIYETNTSNQSEPELTFSVNRLQLSADVRSKNRRWSINFEADRFSPIEQR